MTKLLISFLLGINLVVDIRVNEMKVLFLINKSFDEKLSIYYHSFFFISNDESLFTCSRF